MSALCAFVAGAAALGALGLNAQEVRFFRLGTGSTSGAVFPVGGLLAAAISNPPGSPDCDKGGSCGVPGLIAVAQATAGAVGNVDAIGRGLLDGAIVQGDVAFWAYYGAGIYSSGGAIRDLRAVANLFREVVHLVVRADAPIDGIRDLRDKRVALGEPGSGTLVDAQLILRTFGLQEADLKPSYLRASEAVDRMIAGGLDAIFLVGGFPSPEVLELAQRLPIKLVPIQGPEIETLRSTAPFFTVSPIPPGQYKGVDASVITLGVGTLLLASAKVDDNTVYGITKALWHKSTQAILAKGPPEARRISIDNALAGVPIPLHPGAERYYREAKIIQ
jgi:TRAP transporter TAXI family solute receptor